MDHQGPLVLPVVEDGLDLHRNNVLAEIPFLSPFVVSLSPLSSRASNFPGMEVTTDE